jgi:hypothetical protein
MLTNSNLPRVCGFGAAGRGVFQQERTSMTFAIPSLGKILASHATSGVSVGSTATQTLTHLTKGIHAAAGKVAHEPKFAEILNKAGVSNQAQSTQSPGKS